MQDTPSTLKDGNERDDDGRWHKLGTGYDPSGSAFFIHSDANPHNICKNLGSKSDQSAAVCLGRVPAGRQSPSLVRANKAKKETRRGNK